MLHRVFWYKFTDVSEVFAASIIGTITLLVENEVTKILTDWKIE
jgi:hypothetical protein